MGSTLLFLSGLAFGASLGLCVALLWQAHEPPASEEYDASPPLGELALKGVA